MKDKTFHFAFSYLQHIFGLVFPPDANEKLLRIFETLLVERSNFVSKKSKVKKTLEMLEKSSSKISSGIAKTANFLSNKMKAGVSYLKKKVKPKDQEVSITDKNKQRIKKLKKTSNVVVLVSKTVLEGTINTTANIATGMYNQYEPSDRMKQIAQTEAYKVTKEVGAGCLSAGVNIYNALEDALVTLATTSAQVGVDMVNHRYGQEAGEVTGDALSIVGNAGTAYRDVKKLGLKKLAKGTATNIILEERKG